MSVLLTDYDKILDFHFWMGLTIKGLVQKSRKKSKYMNHENLV